MLVSKKEAKRIIDTTPGKLWVDSFNGVSLIHTKPKPISCNQGKKLVNQADKINHLTNDIFEHLCLDMKNEEIHNIKFPKNGIINQ